MFKKLRVVDGFWLKIIGMITMTFDHLGLFMIIFDKSLYSLATTFRIIGRIAFPIFVFLLVEGVYYTKHPKDYIKRLAIVALAVLIAHVSVIVFYKLQGQVFKIGGNPIIELVCLASFLSLLKLKGLKKITAIIPVLYIIISFATTYYESLHKYITVSWFPEFLRADYSLFGLLICCLFAASRPLLNCISRMLKPAGLTIDQFQLTDEYTSCLNIVKISLLCVLIAILWMIAKLFVDGSGFSRFDPFSINSESYCLLSCIPILFYNGKRGYDSKLWRIITYSYFPMHLIILCGIFVVIYGL